MIVPNEEFTDSEVIHAIEQFLDYAEKEYEKSQQGYFSGNGWAARCLRFQMQKMKDKLRKEKGEYLK